VLEPVAVLLLMAVLLVVLGILFRSDMGGVCFFLSAIMVTGVGLIVLNELNEPLLVGVDFLYPILMFVSAIFLGVVGAGMLLEG
jgi:hypothetical protein